MEIDIKNGKERALTSEKFFDIRSLSWLPDRSGLLITAARIPNKRFRIWQVSAATGAVQPLTKDSETYFALSLDKMAGLLVSTQVKADFRLRLFNLENPSNNQVLADALTVAFAPNERIVFSSAMSGNDEIWSIYADGSEQRQLTNDAADDTTPVASPDNSAVFFCSNRTGAAHVWRMNTDGSNQTQLTFREGGIPLFTSPDGKWIYYHHGLNRTLWRVAVKGGEEQPALNQASDYFALSPEGRRVALAETEGEAMVLTIASLVDGQTLNTFPLTDRTAELRHVAWLPDAKNLVYISVDREGGKTLWLQPLDGHTPRKLAALGDEGISDFALSPDGKKFAVAQGSWRHDAVLMKGLR